MARLKKSLEIILETYNADVADAYEIYADNVENAPRPLALDRRIDVAMLTEGVAQEVVRSASGVLGAEIGAASKRARREVLFNALQMAQRDGADVTPTVAFRAAERVLERGISMRTANFVFGEPGRTAARKSDLTASALEDLEATAIADMETLNPRLADIRQQHRWTWRRSRRRSRIVDDWRNALTEAASQTDTPLPNP